MEGKGLPECYLPLSVAKFRHYTEIFELLRNAGAVPRRQDTNIKGQTKCTLL